MKKILVFILWAFVSIAYAQEYKPMLTDGKEWLCMLEIEGSPDGADGKWPYKITVFVMRIQHWLSGYFRTMADVPASEPVRIHGLLLFGV